MHHFGFKNLALSLAVTGALVALASTPAFAQTPPQAPTPGTGLGLWGEYFDNFDFTGNKPTRTDATVDFQNFQVTAIGTPTGLPTGMTDHNTYVTRWQGVVEIPAGVTSVTFHLRADDGSRLWVDGNLVSDFWRQGGIAGRGASAAGQQATIACNPGELHTIRAEFYEQGGGDGCGLDWSYTGQAAIAVPMINLYNQVAYPRFLIQPGAFADTQMVRIVCDTIGTDVVIRYAVGTVAAPPADIASAAGGLAYTGPIQVSSPNTLIKARAFRASMPGPNSVQVQGVFDVNDTTLPTLTRIQTVAAQQLLLTFSEPLNAAAANTAANYTLSAGTVTTAVVQPNPNLVLLTTTGLATATEYLLTFPNALADRSGVGANVIPAGTARLFMHRVPATGNMVDWYRLDEGTGTAAADASGNGTGGNAGTLEPAAVEPPVWVEGVIGTALYMNGINNSIVTAALEGILGNTCSMSLWFKTQSKGYTNTGDPIGLVGTNDGGGGNDVKFGYFDGTGQIAASVGDGTIADSNTNTFDNLWHHLVITRDSTTGQLTIWIDGVQRAQQNSGTGAKTLTFNRIGMIMNTATTAIRYVGSLDEVKFYNSVLTQQDVWDLYNAPPTVNAGVDQLLPGGVLNANLNGTSITDDGFGNATPGITWTWSQVSGPAGVTFTPTNGNGNNADTQATFPGPGTYVLRLRAFDGSLSCSDDVTVDVPRVSVTPSTGLVTSEAAVNNTATFNIDFVTANAAPVTVTITSNLTTEGTVSVPGSFGATPVAGGITFVVPAGPAQTIVVTVTGQPDNIDDGNRAYVVTVATTSASPGFTVTRTVNLTNLDIDTAGVTVTPPAGGLLVDEGAATPTTDNFSIRLNSIPTAPVQFFFTITPAPIPGQAFTLSQPSVTFPASAAALTPVVVTLTAQNDAVIELTQFYTIVIQQNTPSLDPNYAAANPADLPVTVLDDEVIPALPKVWGCGLSGLEILLPLGLAALLRRRRRA